MTDIWQDIAPIVWLSLQVSGSATLIAAGVGFTLAGLLASTRFPGRGTLLVVFSSLTGLPPVTVGLIVYLALSRAGPLGELGLLFTPSAMIIAQTILIIPIITILAVRTFERGYAHYGPFLASLGLSRVAMMPTIAREHSHEFTIALLTGMGRALAEVGAVLIVGGNIKGVTRIMTTAISLETSMGQLDTALALGLTLIALIFILNVLIMALRRLLAPPSGER